MNKNLMVLLLRTLLREELTEKAMLLTFKEAGIVTGKEGLIVKFTDGSELQITVEDSKNFKEHREDETEKSSNLKIKKKLINYPQNSGKYFVY